MSLAPAPRCSSLLTCSLPDRPLWQRGSRRHRGCRAACAAPGRGDRPQGRRRPRVGPCRPLCRSRKGQAAARRARSQGRCDRFAHPPQGRSRARGRDDAALGHVRSPHLSPFCVSLADVAPHVRRSHGGQEAHLLASELAASRIGVILSPPRSFPATWDERRSLPGPPLTPDTAQTVLHRAGVVVALGSEEEWMPRSVVQEAAWAQRLSRGEVSRRDAVAWVSTNLEELFGLDDEREEDAKVDFAAFEVRPRSSSSLSTRRQLDLSADRSPICSAIRSSLARAWLPSRPARASSSSRRCCAPCRASSSRLCATVSPFSPPLSATRGYIRACLQAGEREREGGEKERNR